MKKNVSHDVFCHVTKLEIFNFGFVFCNLSPLQSLTQKHPTKHGNFRDL